MASLGAVYGISFVAGSLASMGSAYMASKIYPIEDDVLPIEEPAIEENQTVGGRNPTVAEKKELDEKTAIWKSMIPGSQERKDYGEEIKNLRIKIYKEEPRGNVDPPQPESDVELKTISDWIDNLVKKKIVIHAIGDVLLEDFFRRNTKITPDIFLDKYVQIIEKKAKEKPPNVVPRLSATTADFFIKDPSMIGAPVGGSQHGGTMDDFAAFDIISSIVELRERKEDITWSDIIENGPFKDNKTTITFDILEKIKKFFTAFHGVISLPQRGEFNTKIETINNKRTTKVLTVKSWLRTVPRKTAITDKDIAEIVFKGSSLSIKQFVDILCESISIDKKTNKPNIQIVKSVFTKVSNIVPQTYVFDEKISKLIDQVNNSIDINHIIKYFETGSLYTFFHFKNVLRVVYDFQLGDKEFDKILINLSKIIKWLKMTAVNKITNEEINKVKIDKKVLVDTLAFLIKRGVRINGKIIRVTDFNAIETLDSANAVINTKIIQALIDPDQITLPKPTAQQLQNLETFVEKKSPIDENDLILASLFVGSIELPNSSSITKYGSINKELPPDTVSVLSLLDQIQGDIDKRNKDALEVDKTRKDYKMGENVKQAKAYMKQKESEKERKMMEESLRKDEMIKQLENTRKTYEESKTLQDAAKAKFDKNLEKLVSVNKLKELESLLKERDAELAKEYEKAKISDDKNNKSTEDQSSSVSKENYGLKKCGNPAVNVGDKCFDRKLGTVRTKTGGYNQTLRNHLRSRRFTRRRI